MNTANSRYGASKLISLNFPPDTLLVPGNLALCKHISLFFVATEPRGGPVTSVHTRTVRESIPVQVFAHPWNTSDRSICRQDPSTSGGTIAA